MIRIITIYDGDMLSYSSSVNQYIYTPSFSLMKFQIGTQYIKCVSLDAEGSLG